MLLKNKLTSNLPKDVLNEIWDFNKSVSVGFPKNFFKKLLFFL